MQSARGRPGTCFGRAIPFRHFLARTVGPPGVLLVCFPRVAAESTCCAVFGWPGLPAVLRPRPRASCLHSVFVHRPAFLRPASFIQPLRDQTLPFATLAAIRPGVELIPCIAPSFPAICSAFREERDTSNASTSSRASPAHNQRLDLTVKTPVDSVKVYVHGRSALTLVATCCCITTYE